MYNRKCFTEYFSIEIVFDFYALAVYICYVIVYVLIIVEHLLS